MSLTDGGNTDNLKAEYSLMSIRTKEQAMEVEEKEGMPGE